MHAYDHAGLGTWPPWRGAEVTYSRRRHRPSARRAAPCLVIVCRPDWPVEDINGNKLTSFFSIITAMHDTGLFLGAY